jgi:hypothetical protein
VTKPVIRITEAEAEQWRKERGVAPASTHSVGDRYFLRPAQKDGDWSPLAQYLDMGGEVTPAIRTFLAAVLRGEAKRPPKTRRPIKGATLTGQAEAAALVFKLKPVARDYIRQAAREMGRDDEAGLQFVKRAAKAWPQMNADLAAWILSARGRGPCSRGRGVAASQTRQ